MKTRHGKSDHNEADMLYASLEIFYKNSGGAVVYEEFPGTGEYTLVGVVAKKFQCHASACQRLHLRRQQHHTRHASITSACRSHPISSITITTQIEVEVEVD